MTTPRAAPRAEGRRICRSERAEPSAEPAAQRRNRQRQAVAAHGTGGGNEPGRNRRSHERQRWRKRDGTGGAMSGTGGSSTGGDAGPMTAATAVRRCPPMGSCGPPNTNYASDLGDPMKLGPWMPSTSRTTGPSGQSWIFYPDALGKDGLKHPVFDWGPGAGTGPDCVRRPSESARLAGLRRSSASRPRRAAKRRSIGSSRRTRSRAACGTRSSIPTA